MLFDIDLNPHIYLITILISTAVFGDYVVKQSKLHLYQALFDNIIHGLIGAFSWLIVSLTHRNRYSVYTLVEIALCMVIASLIDLDHFVTARSFYLKDATSLKNRPILHCTTVPLVLVSVFACIAYYQRSKWMWRFSFLVLTAFISHHTRDALRRGFWFCPFGSTKPIPYFAYITLTVIIPYVICLFVNYAPSQKSTDAIIV